MKEPLSLFLIAWTLTFFFRRPVAFGRSGALVGLGALTRGNVLFLALPFLHAAWRRRSKRKAGLFLAMLLLALLPATLMNAFSCHCFVPINYTDGFNLYLGHFPDADGVSYRFPAGIASGPEQEERDTTALASRAEGRTLSPAEVSAYWRQQAWMAIQANPWHEVTLAKNKLLGLIRQTETFDNYDLAFLQATFPTLLNAPLATFALTAFLAPIGAFLAFRRRSRTVKALLSFAGFYALSLILFYVTTRYRQPLLLFLFPLAGAALPELIRALRANAIERFAPALALGLVFGGLSFWPSPPQDDLTAYDWGMLAMVEVEQKHDVAALQAVQKALAHDPLTAGGTTFIKGSIALERLGRPDDAKRLLRQGATFYPNDAALFYEQGRIDAATGDLAEADRAFAKAIAINPAYLLASYARALLLMRNERWNEAAELVQRALTIDPNAPLLRHAQEAIVARQAPPQE
jgi:tetratricopeptide (TPR) repeat protein